jgi:hypothetical protein
MAIDSLAFAAIQSYQPSVFQAGTSNFRSMIIAIEGRSMLLRPLNW